MRKLTILVTVLIVSNCGTTATIYKKDGTTVEGWIESGDSSSIFLEGGNEINRSDIKDIDHPGNVAVILSSWPAALGIVLTAAAIKSNDLAAFIPFLVGIGIGLPSIIVSIWGWYTWGRSRSAASEPLSTTEGPKIAPVALSDGERTYWGLGMSWYW